MKTVSDKIIPIRFSYLDTKLIGLLKRIFSLFCPNKLLRFYRKCLRMGFCKLFLVFNIFSNFELKYLYFAHEIRTSLSKLLSNSSEEIVDDNAFMKKFFFYLFSDFDQNFFWICLTSFQQGCQKSNWRC